MMSSLRTPRFRASSLFRTLTLGARRWHCLALAAVLLTAVSLPASAQVVISQVYGGGGNSGATWRNDFIELFNRGTSPVDLTGWSVQYASAAGTSWSRTVLLAKTLQPGQYYLIQEAAGSGGTVSLPTPDATGSIAISATAGKVALVNNSTTLTGSCPTGVVDFAGFGTTANCFEGAGPTAAPSNTNAVLRSGDGCGDTNSNNVDFTAGPAAPRNSSSVAYTCPQGTQPTPPTAVGIASENGLFVGEQTILTVSVTPGTNPPSTGLAVQANLTPVGGSATQAFAGQGSNVFSFTATVAAGTSPGVKAINVSVSDAQTRTGSTTISLTVAPTPPPDTAIHVIQGNGSTTPLAGETVATTGIVTGRKYNGFFLQAPESSYDSDPMTSEGIFVYTSSAPPAAASVGNSVRVVGIAQEFNAVTEIAASAVRLLSSGSPLPTPMTLTTTKPNPAGTPDQLECYEGMLVNVDSLTVVGPSNASGQFFGVAAGVGRPFREPGIEPGAPELTWPPYVPRFDGNPERLLVDSTALGGTALVVTSNAVVTGLVGPLDYQSSSGSYAIDSLGLPTVAGNIAAVPVRDAAAGEFTVASFNMLDFNATSPRLQKAVLAIRDIMKLPDIIGVQELTSLTALQTLANAINSNTTPSPNYQPYLLAASGSQRVGFLVKGSVGVTSVTEVGKNATFTDPRDPTGNTKLTTFDRPPLVLEAVFTDPRGASFPLTAIANHLRSLIDVDADTGTGDFVRSKRQAGAEWLADFVQALRASGKLVVSVGDYNAYQFNDGYVDVIGTIIGVPTPPNQVVLSSSDLVDPNFADLVSQLAPAGRYSYLESGNAQVLDHVIVSPDMVPLVRTLAYARVDADFPAAYSSDAGRPERVSDHDPAVAYFSFPTADVSLGVSAAPLGEVALNSSVTYTVTVANGADDPAAGLIVTDTLPDGMIVTNVKYPSGWTCGWSATSVGCQANILGGRSNAIIEITAKLDCGLSPGDLTSQLMVTTTSFDSDLSNNETTAVTTAVNPPPTITGEAVAPLTLWPVNHKMIPVTVDYLVTDNCDPNPTCGLTVGSSEPTDGRGDGHTATDWLVVDAHTLFLRAERSGTATGRTYTVTITCEDSTHAAATKKLFVTVPKSMGNGKK